VCACIARQLGCLKDLHARASTTVDFLTKRACNKIVAVSDPITRCQAVQIPTRGAASHSSPGVQNGAVALRADFDEFPELHANDQRKQSAPLRRATAARSAAVSERPHAPDRAG
jgi:hypothetical protein